MLEINLINTWILIKNISDKKVMNNANRGKFKNRYCRNIRNKLSVLFLFLILNYSLVVKINLAWNRTNLAYLEKNIIFSFHSDYWVTYYYLI